MSSFLPTEEVSRILVKEIGRGFQPFYGVRIGNFLKHKVVSKIEDSHHFAAFLFSHSVLA